MRSASKRDRYGMKKNKILNKFSAAQREKLQSEEKLEGKKKN